MVRWRGDERFPVFRVIVTVQVQLEAIPPDQSGRNPGRQSRVVDIEAATYEQARDRGWRVIDVRPFAGTALPARCGDVRRLVPCGWRAGPGSLASQHDKSHGAS